MRLDRKSISSVLFALALALPMAACAEEDEEFVETPETEEDILEEENGRMERDTLREENHEEDAER